MTTCDLCKQEILDNVRDQNQMVQYTWFSIWSFHKDCLTELVEREIKCQTGSDTGVSRAMVVG